MRLLFIITILFAFSAPALAQEGLECRIFYDYDDAGNRVKRYHHCYDPNLQEVGTPSYLYPYYVFPNPTAGTVTIAFNERVKYVRLTVVDMGGRVIGSATEGVCYEMDCELLGGHAPGTYVLRLEVTRDNDEEVAHEFTVVKL